MAKKKSGVRRSPEAEAKRQILLDKIRSKQGTMRSNRAPGSSPNMTKAMNMMGGANMADNQDMIRDMQKEMKGVRGNKANKYMRDLVSGMDDTQMDSLSEMTKTQSPGITQNINSIITQQKCKSIESKKIEPLVNPDTVYVPVDEMTPDEIEREKKRRVATGRRKRKAFATIQINVPNIAELQKQQTEGHAIPVPKPIKRTVGETTPPIVHSQKSIDSLFDFETKEAPRIYPALTNRLSKIKVFRACRQNVQLQTTILEAEDTRSFRVITSVDRLTVVDHLIVPDSEQVSDTKPSSEDGAFVVTQRADGKWTRSINCMVECQEFARKLDDVFLWVKSLENRQLPMNWLCQELHTMGIFVHDQTEASFDFHLYTNEHNIKPDTVSVPEIPFIRIKLK